ncbi:MAG: hypothetical protein WBQ25_10970 [Nitrososphaeraceae archaeon]
MYTREYYYKHELDYAIVEMLEQKYPSHLRYSEIEKEINSYLSYKIPSATLSFHLTDLYSMRNVLEKKKKRNGYTYYSLTREFKEVLDKQKKIDPTYYTKEALSLRHFNRQLSFPLY